jgi:tetratricopeptide (TPR) repeat protein
MIPRATSLALLLCLALTAGLSAQEAPAPAPTEGQPPTEPIIQEAVAKLDAGDDAEAIRILETLKTQENPPLQGLALLGALYLHSSRPLDALDVLEPLAQLQPPDPAVLYNAGRAAMALGQNQRAAGYFQQSVQLQPSSPAARELGLMLGSQGMYTQALAFLKPWAQNNPNDFEVRLAGALCAVQLERVPDAEELLSDLPQDQPQVSLLWSRVLLIKGDPWGALNTLKPALETAPQQMQLDIRRALAEAYAAVGQAAEAVAVLEGFTESDPSIALQLSQAQYQGGELDGAIATLRPYAERMLGEGQTQLPPELASRMTLDYGRYLAMTGDQEGALPYLELATRMNASEKQGWQALGQALAGLGRREEAQAALERFQEISKAEISASKQELQDRAELDDPTLRALRETYALMSEQKFDAALLRIQEERALSRNDLRPVLLEARLLTIVERYPEALAIAEDVVRAAPDNADAVYLRGTVHMAMGSNPQAEADFRQALVLQPEHLATMNDLAVLLIDTGNPGEARELLERVLERNPNDRVAAENLADLEG